jgi:hypothetical protein
MVIKYTDIFHSKALQNLPKLGFLKIENKPSGNPAPSLDWILCGHGGSAKVVTR